MLTYIIFGDTAIIVPVDAPDAIAAAIDEAVALEPGERQERRWRAREHALQFDRGAVFDRLFAAVPAGARRPVTVV